jgi:hypothetical protein
LATLLERDAPVELLVGPYNEMLKERGWYGIYRSKYSSS